MTSASIECQLMLDRCMTPISHDDKEQGCEMQHDMDREQYENGSDFYPHRFTNANVRESVLSPVNFIWLPDNLIHEIKTHATLKLRSSQGKFIEVEPELMR
jgi:hypothetical protein